MAARVRMVHRQLEVGSGHIAECIFGPAGSNGAAMARSNMGSVHLNAEPAGGAVLFPKPSRRTPGAMIRFKPSVAARLRSFASIAISLCVLGAAGFALAREVSCPHTNVTVISVDDHDVGIACEAAREAVGFFAANGLDTSGPVKVRLVRELPDVASSSSYGCYDHRSRTVCMLHFHECLEQGPWANFAIDRTLYKSLLTHEVAHALADMNFAVQRPNTLAHEYLAYVTMFATMPAGERKRVLEQFPGTGFDSVDQMSVTYYLMNPLRFGAEAYRHFLKLGDKKTFLKDVLSGRVSIGRNPSS